MLTHSSSDLHEMPATANQTTRAYPLCGRVSRVRAHKSPGVFPFDSPRVCLATASAVAVALKRSGHILLSLVPLKHHKHRVIRHHAQHQLAGVGDHAYSLEQQLLHNRANQSALGGVTHRGVGHMQSMLLIRHSRFMAIVARAHTR